MKNRPVRTIISAMFLVNLIFFTACQEQNQVDSKKYKLLADENYRIKCQFEQYKDQINKQEKLLEECKQQYEQLKKDKQDSTNFLMKTVVSEYMQKNAQLEAENKTLKAQIEQLKDELSKTQPSEN